MPWRYKEIVAQSRSEALSKFRQYLKANGEVGVDSLSIHKLTKWEKKVEGTFACNVWAKKRR